MRICLLTRYFDFRNAGLGRVSSEIANRLIKRGHSVQKISTNGTSLYSYFFYTLCGIPLRLPRSGFDVYHALTPMEGMWIPKNKGIVTFHDLFQITDKNNLGSGLGYSKWRNLIGTNYFRLVVNISKNCEKIVAVSDKTKWDIVNYLGISEEKIRVIRSGIREDLKPTPQKDKVFRVGYLGQLDKRKRVNLLIEAFRESNLDELVIGGTGPDEEILIKQAARDPRIKFTGFVPDNELGDFYNSLNVFVFPTALEGYGLPIVEAMACKKPVVVLNDSIIPLEVKDRCITVDKLDYVLGSQTCLEELCKSINIEGNYRWAKEHSWDRCVNEYVKLYEEIIEYTTNL